MDTHAPLTPKGREAMVRSMIEGGLTKAAAAHKFNNGSTASARKVSISTSVMTGVASTRRGSPENRPPCPPCTRASQAPVLRQSRTSSIAVDGATPNRLRDEPTRGV